MPSEFVGFLRDLAKTLLKFDLKKLDKYQTFNGFFDLLATIGFLFVCFRVDAEHILLAFFGWLAVTFWCVWMCFRIGKA